MTEASADPAAFFHALLTDPDTATDLLETFTSRNTRGMLVSCGAQSAICSAFTALPRPAQIRDLVKQMRRCYDEPIDSFAVVTIINACLAPESVTFQRRLDSLDSRLMRRVSLLLPHALFAASNASDTDVEQWVDQTLTHFHAGMRLLRTDFGDDFGEFYRVVCTDPVGANAVLDADTTMPEHQQSMMAFNAAVGALRFLFPDGEPDPQQRSVLADRIIQQYGQFPTDVLDALIDACWHDAQPTGIDPTDLYAVALLLPSIMVTTLSMTTKGITDFMRVCKQAEQISGAFPGTPAPQ